MNSLEGTLAVSARKGWRDNNKKAGTLSDSGEWVDGAPAGAVATTTGATATIAGATATAEGAILMANSASNPSQGYNRGKSNNSEESSWENKPKSAGHMRKITFILKMAHQ